MIATLGSVRLGIINKCIIITIKKQKKRVARISGFKKKENYTSQKIETCVCIYKQWNTAASIKTQKITVPLTRHQ